MKLVKHFLVASFLLLPLCASAHPGHEVTYGFMSGFLHPLLGLDHLMAMVGIGLWSMQQSGHLRWTLPTTFIVTIMVGAALGFSGVGLSSVELGIPVSLLMLGLLVVRTIKLPAMLSGALVAFFALFHGYAHGSEMPIGMDLITYFIGFMVSSVSVVVVTIQASKWILINNHKSSFSMLGGIMCLYGIALLS